MTSSETLSFNDFDGLNILVVGDVMIDRYLTGQVERISPEAPVPVVRLGDTEDRLGGAANVALNLRAMGARPLLCSVIGRDEAAEALLRLLPEADLPDWGFYQSAERRTTVKTRVIAQHQHLLRLDREDTHELSSREAEDFLQHLLPRLDNQPIDAVLLQDYNKGVLSGEVIRVLIDWARQRNIPITVDPKFQNFWAYRQVTIFKPNLREIQQQLGFSVTPDPLSLERAALEIYRRLDNHHTMITLSEHGIYWYDGKKGHIFPTQARSVADVCGAGDTVIAVATLGIALHLPPATIVDLANLAGGQVCEKVGVVPVDREQLRREFRQLSLAADK